ncbi:hypothetical protein GCM10022226_17080 [Sphaerisporangium flaviroseum]|uniref:Uncharacterized protein n=1 Tax=Sphaerisporangium flaviroseum TaxID=509199 RepID=A0ABP7HQ79_9ACTN
MRFVGMALITGGDELARFLMRPTSPGRGSAPAGRAGVVTAEGEGLG